MTGSSSPFLASSVRSRPNARSAGVLMSFFAPDASGPSCSDSDGVKFGSSSLRISLRVRSISSFETLEHSGSNPLAFAQKSKQNVFRADIRMIQRLRFLARQCQYFFDPRGVGNVADNLGLRPRANLFFHFHANGLKIEAHLLQNVHRHALPKLDKAQEQMLGANVIVVKPVGFLASKRQNLLSPGCEVIHCSMAWSSSHCQTLPPSY